MAGKRKSTKFSLLRDDEDSKKTNSRSKNRVEIESEEPPSNNYSAAFLEYAADVLTTAGNGSMDDRKKKILPKHIQKALKNDKALTKFIPTQSSQLIRTGLTSLKK